MEPKMTFFSLSIDTLAMMPGALTLGNRFILLDNSQTPFITALTDAWKGVPVKTNDIMVILCTSGEMNVRIAFEEYTLTEGSVCIVLPGNVIEVLSASEDFHCFLLSMDSKFMNLDQSYTLQLMQLFKYIQRQPCYTLTGMNATRYKETFAEARKTMEWTDNPLREKMVQAYVYLLYCCIFPTLEKNQQDFTDNKTVTHQKELYFKFMELVQASYTRQRTVAWYAEQLGITPKYLSKVVNSESGQPALKWIENFIILDAKALLKQSNLTIQMVSDRLNFPDQSTFGKFFRRNVGMTPKEYREG